MVEINDVGHEPVCHIVWSRIAQIVEVEEVSVPLSDFFHRHQPVFWFLFALRIQ